MVYPYLGMPTWLANKTYLDGRFRRLAEARGPCFSIFLVPGATEDGGFFEVGKKY